MATPSTIGWRRARSSSTSAANQATDNGYGDSDQLFGIENVVGTDFDDSLTGDGEINVLDGGLGADTMTGGDGSDSYVVDNVGDQVIEAGTGGRRRHRQELGQLHAWRQCRESRPGRPRQHQRHRQ